MPEVRMAKKGGPKRAFRNMVVSLVFVLLVAAIALIFWARPVQGTLGNPREVALAGTTFQRLQEMKKEGRRATVKLRELQWNAWILEKQKASGGKEGGLLPQTVRLRVDVEPDMVLICAEDAFLGMTVSTQVTLKLDSELMAWEISRVEIGRLPLPPSVGLSLLEGVGRRFGLHNEMDMLRSLRPMKLAKDIMIMELVSSATGF